MPSIRTYLHDIQYFEGITQEEVQFLEGACLWREFSAGESIFLEGEPAEGLWVVARGTVKIFKLNEEGTEHILHLCGEGKTFNDIGALDGGLNPANASALNADVGTWFIPIPALTYIVTHNPQIAINVIRLLALRVRSLVNQIEDLALYSVIVRLARFLLKQADDPSLSSPGITRTAIAAHLGTTPQTVSVALRQLETAQAIAFNRHQIIITDEKALQAIAML